MKTELLTTFDGTEELKRDWDSLVVASGNSVFSKYSFSRNIERFYGDLAKVQTYLFYEGNQLIAIAPLAEENGVLRFLTGLEYTGVADYCDFIVNPDERKKVYEGLKNLFKGRKFNLKEIPGKSPTLELLTSDMVNVHTENLCGAVSLTGNFQEYLAQIGKSYSYSYRRFQNAFPNTVLERVSDNSELADIMSQFIDMHQQNWDSRGKSGAFGKDEKSTRFRNYHLNLVQELQDDSNLALMQLKVGDKTIAIDYCFEDEKDFYVYLRSISDSEQFRKYSPGRMMIFHLIKYAFDLGKTKLDLLRGDEPYKNEFKVIWTPNKTISSN